MRTILALAMIVGSSTFLHAGAARHHAAMPQQAESFVGTTLAPRLAAPLDRSLGPCRGGACTLTGGPSGGPNQS